jgi:putative exporter of polyketide antibiotics
MLKAGLNAMAPVVFLAGIGLLAVGYIPRYVSKLLYAIIGWSFLIQILGSIGNINHWILDTSLLHHIALAPAVESNWYVAGRYVGLGLITGVLGVLRFMRRDLQNE